MACERVKGFLSQAGVSVITRDVDEDPSAYDELIALGFRSVPVTVIGSDTIRGFQPELLRAAVERAAHGPDSSSL
jgi:glutaredoxin